MDTAIEVTEIPSLEHQRKELYDLTQTMLAYGLATIELRAMFTKQLELEAKVEYLENALHSMPGAEELELGGVQKALQAKINDIKRQIKSR